LCNLLTFTARSERGQVVKYIKELFAGGQLQ
jgi:hypothetical protein